MATKPGRSTKGPTRSATADVGEALDDAGSELRKAVDELFLKIQRADSEAQFACAQEVHQAELDQTKGDTEAHYALMQALQEAEGREDYQVVVLERTHEYELGVQERRQEAQKRVAAAGETYRASVEASQQEYANELREIYLQHIAALKAVWASIKPEAVETDQLARLGHLTMAAAQSIPAAPPPATATA